MRTFRGYGAVAGGGGPVPEQVEAQRERLARRLAGVRTLVAVASGKGGVGKSAITANLAAALAADGRRVGAADTDLNGPTLGRMLGVPGGSLRLTPDGVEPSRGAGGVATISMELLLAEADRPTRWRGPAADGSLWRGALEFGAVREFLADVAWGTLDFLLVDLPPGTDRLERLLELVPRPGVTLLVTLPSAAATAAVARAARLLREEGVERVGLVANMTGVRCGGCGREEALFPGDALAELEAAAGSACWARIPFDPRLSQCTDAGRPLVLEAPESPAAQAIRALAARLERESAA